MEGRTLGLVDLELEANKGPKRFALSLAEEATELSERIREELDEVQKDLSDAVAATKLHLFLINVFLASRMIFL